MKPKRRGPSVQSNTSKRKSNEMHPSFLAVRDAGGVIYKNVDKLEAAMRGESDLDLYVDVARLEELRETFWSLGGVQGKLSPLHDNVGANREEWFFLEPGLEGPIHLDIVSRFKTGPKFSKELDFLALEDLGDNLEKDELGYEFTLLGEETTQQLNAVKQAFSGLNSEFKELRLEVAEKNGVTTNQMRLMWVKHYLKKSRYYLQRVLEKIGFIVLPKRQLETGGAVIALLGPDGVGKTTQVRNLRRFLSAKFSLRNVYMGHTGLFSALAHHLRKDNVSDTSSQSKPKSPRSGLKAEIEEFMRGVWGIWLALTRLRKAHWARKSAQKGYLVLSDRWPQNLERGYLDGPIRRVMDKANPITEVAFKIENKIFDLIEKQKPDLMIQLVIPYEVANARKPGELSPDAFEQRINLLHRMHNKSPESIEIVDVSASEQSVFADLTTAIWRHLSRKE